MDGFKSSRVYFAPCGIGLGHVSRTVPIAQGVIRRGGTVLFSTYLEAVQYVKDHHLPVVEAPPIYLSNDSSGSIDLKASVSAYGLSIITTFLDQVKFEIHNMQAFKPDLVFSDTRVSTIYAARLLGIPVVLLLNQFLPLMPRDTNTNLYRIIDGINLTIFGRTWNLSKIILVPDFPEPYTISLDSLRIPRRIGARVKLVGAILPQVPREDYSRKQARENLGVRPNEILVYAGISGPPAERMPLIRILTSILQELPDRFKVVMSMGEAGGDSTPRTNGSFTRIPWVENRFDYLNACDIVISRGGHQTIMQSISYRKPSIIIPVPRHPEQYGNARRAMELGVAKALHQRDVSVDVLVKNIDQIMESGECVRRLNAMNDERSLGEGLERILETISEYLPGK